MDLAYKLIGYYTKVTKKEWYDFFTDIIEITKTDISELTDEPWLKKQIWGILSSNGYVLSNFISRRDELKAYFDKETRIRLGEFYTPITLAETLHKKMDEYIPNWRDTYTVWEPTAGTGNLIKTAGIKTLYASTLNQEDVDLLSTVPSLSNANIFQLDFLSKVDDMFNRPFTESLPNGLRETIENNKPLIILSNPPYKASCDTRTNVSDYMRTPIPYLDNINFTDTAFDFFNQFLFQFINITKLYNLTNTYLCFFGPTLWLNGKKTHKLLKTIRTLYNVEYGFIVDKSEFADTSKDIAHSICALILKSKQVYTEDTYKKIDLEVINKGVSSGVITFKEYSASYNNYFDTTPTDYKLFPVLSSAIKLHNGEDYGRAVHKYAKLRSDILFTMYFVRTVVSKTKTETWTVRLAQNDSMLQVTERNFKHAVVYFACKNILKMDWKTSKKYIDFYDNTIDGFDEWYANVLPLISLDYKALVSAYRGLYDKDDIYKEKHDYDNPVTLVTPEYIKEHCTDGVVLKDLDSHPQTDFQKKYIQMIEDSKPYWKQETWDLYNFCMDTHKKYISNRGTVGYKGSLEAWDSAFNHVRRTMWFEDTELNKEYALLLNKHKDLFRPFIYKIGFIKGE